MEPESLAFRACTLTAATRPVTTIPEKPLTIASNRAARVLGVRSPYPMVSPVTKERHHHLDATGGKHRKRPTGPIRQSTRRGTFRPTGTIEPASSSFGNRLPLSEVASAMSKTLHARLRSATRSSGVRQPPRCTRRTSACRVNAQWTCLNTLKPLPRPLPITSVPWPTSQPARAASISGAPPTCAGRNASKTRRKCMPLFGTSVAVSKVLPRAFFRRARTAPDRRHCPMCRRVRDLPRRPPFAQRRRDRWRARLCFKVLIFAQP